MSHVCLSGARYGPLASAMEGLYFGKSRLYSVHLVDVCAYSLVDVRAYSLVDVCAY